uniref:Putative secreted protein n=1 Tax=Ixodes ricinus TaxID=34613 RepID=A0A6B0UE40_IXORI
MSWMPLVMASVVLPVNCPGSPWSPGCFRVQSAPSSRRGLHRLCLRCRCCCHWLRRGRWCWHWRPLQGPPLSPLPPPWPPCLPRLWDCHSHHDSPGWQ